MVLTMAKLRMAHANRLGQNPRIYQNYGYRVLGENVLKSGHAVQFWHIFVNYSITVTKHVSNLNFLLEGV